MTYAEVTALYEEPVNTRWACCYAALSRQPMPWEYILWNRQKLELFYKEIDWKGQHDLRALISVYGSMEKVHEAYDSWLQDHISQIS